MPSDTTDEYLARLPDIARGTVSAVRDSVRAIVPGAVEVFAYGMPGFTYRGKPLVYVAAWKNHCALYGVAGSAPHGLLETSNETWNAEGWDVKNGTIRFPLDAGVPEHILRALLEARIEVIDAALASPR